ncbi:MAG TPA: TatD family hydrolase [Longimicrobiaceae bacterium]|nr:TatD family hydrolase [Longimicrobiaceae bacterium]
MTLIDSHAHLTDERLLAEAAEVVERARAAGVRQVVTIGTTPEDSRRAIELASRLPGVFATAGIHPHSADAADDDAFARLEVLARSPRVVALGETGLDYFYDNSPHEAQRRAFAHHLELARALELPVVVHSRDADEDLRAMLREEASGTRGVLHCFTGGRALLEAALAAGWYISFAGTITFRNFADTELLRAVPLDRILVETDSPYLAPVPHRGKRNEPAYVPLVARRAAELRGEDPEEFGAATIRNTRALYRLEEESDA